MAVMKKVYLDHASTTPLDPRVLKVMMPYLKDSFGNPGSLHSYGVESKRAVERARRSVADLFGGHPDEIVFTSGGTESNNLAITGLIRKLEISHPLSSMHVVTTAIEHSSVLEVLRVYERKGLRVTYVPVDVRGMVNLSLLKKALCSETVMVSVMHANNEIGTVQPIREIARIVRHSLRTIRYGLVDKPIVHVDASQTPLYCDVNVGRLGVDLVTIDSQKMYGPKGVGALFVRRGIELEPLIFGGGQERGIRGGTENVPGIVGMGRAVALALAERESEVKRLTALRKTFLTRFFKIYPSAALNGDHHERLPGNINVSIPDVDTEFLMLQLDAKGLCVSTKSTCVRDQDDSYVVSALATEPWRARHSLRISFGRTTTADGVRKFLSVLKSIAQR